ncbi:MAG: CBS domain-containing protein [Nitrosotalea sp.]
MVITLEGHHVDISHKTLGMINNAAKDLPNVVPSSDCTTISSIMTRNVVTIDHTKTAYDAANIMIEKRIGCVIVTAYGKPFGIVTERDLARIVATLAVPSKCLILSYLASRPLIYANPTISIQEAANILGRYNIDHLPILESDKIVGIVTTRDLAMYLLYA